MIATDVAARGLDIKDVVHVINFDCPKVCKPDLCALFGEFFYVGLV